MSISLLYVKETSAKLRCILKTLDLLSTLKTFFLNYFLTRKIE